MARKWDLFHRRIQSFLKQKIYLLIIGLLTFSFCLTIYPTNRVVAKNQKILSNQELAKIEKQLNLSGDNSLFDSQELLITQKLNGDDNLLTRGLELYQRGNFIQAKQEWLKAVEIYHQANDNFNQALALNYLSLTYQKLGEWQPAQETINQSWQLIETEINGSHNAQKSAIFARILNTKGKVSLKLRKPELALADWRRSEAIYQQLNDTQGVLISQLNQARALRTIGRFRDSLTLLSNLENKLENQADNIKINGLITLAQTLREVGQFTKSQEILVNILTLENINKNQSPLLLSNILIELGNTQRAIATQEIENLTNQTNFFASLREQNTITKLEDALNSYQQVIDLGIPQIKLQAQLNKLSLLADISQISFAQGQKSQGQIPAFLQKFTQEALDFWSDITLPKNSDRINQNSIYSQINLADSLIRLKSNSQFFNGISWSQIDQLLQNAIAQAQIMELQRSESEAWGKRGRIAEIKQDWANAEQFTQQALILSQTLNAKEISYKWQWQLGRIKQQLNQQQEAIKAYSNAIATLGTLRNDLVAVSSDLEFNFRENVEPVYRELVSILLTEKATPEEIKQARDVIEALQLAELDNFFQVACVEARPILIDQVTQQQDPTAAIIYTIALSDRFEIILKLPQAQIRHYSTPINNVARVERLLERLAQSLTQPNSPETLPLAQQAYDWFIRPLETDLTTREINTLVFVLDSPLRNLPMSVLHDGQQYLLEKYAIALSPGLKLIEPQPIASQELKAITAGLTEAREGFAPLRYVAQELNQIQSQVSASEQLLNSNFTSNAFQEKINQLSFPVVHLATHGQFSSQAENTFILTWSDRINVNQFNSLLRSRNPREQKPLELLVLSACETLTGDKRATLGLAGIAVRAGTRSTLATLWRVNDEASALLMGKFYQELANQNKSLTKAEALRKAQLSLLEDSRFNRPYFWGAYVLVGNWL